MRTFFPTTFLEIAVYALHIVYSWTRGVLGLSLFEAEANGEIKLFHLD